MKVLKKILFRRCLLLFAVLSLSIDAFGISFSVDAPRQVVQGNKFNISYVLENANGSAFSAPEVAGCTLLFGPSVSQSMSSYSVNGKMTSSSSQTYTMTYRADKHGTYKIGSATITVNGKVYKTNAFSLEILPPDKSAASGRQSQSVQIYDADTQTSDKTVGKNDVFVRIILSKSQAYEQEGIMCTIKLYTKYNIQQFMPTLQPSFNGFISQEVPITSSINRMENYKGENYAVADLKQCILFPQQSGKLTITSGNYDLTVVQYETVRSMFGMMRRPVEKQIKVQSNSASVTILPLPQPQPADFYGAVGSFTVSNQLLNGFLKTNEAGTLRMTIKGTGNLKNIRTPEIDFPSQFDVYDAQTTVNANPSGNALSGSVVIDYAFVPQYVGKFKIPATSFSYFNPNTQKYEQIKLNGYDLDIAKGSSSNAVARNDIKQNKDILYIKTGNLSLSDSASYLLVRRWGYYLWYLCPFLLFCVILFYYRKTIKERANVALMRTKRANKVAIKRLKTARQLMQAQKKDKFYEEMLRAIWGYFSDKLTIPVSELNRDNILTELYGYGVAEAVGNEAITLLDRCEFAQYAKQEDGGDDMNEVYQTACDLINRIENTKRKKNNE